MKNSAISLAEQILFPPHDDSDDSSDEQSDWIVSDVDEEYVDLKESLECSSRNAEGKILYHPEERTRDAFVSDKDLEDILSSPLIDAVCKDGGVDAVRDVIAIHSKQYELDATDDKGNWLGWFPCTYRVVY